MVKTAVERQKAVWELDLGASFDVTGTAHFKVWAPHPSNLSLQIEGKGVFPMECDALGYRTCTLEGLEPGARYLYQLENDGLYPDPVSRSLPDGLHGATEVVDHAAFEWNDATWKGLELRDAIIYELHVGTYTADGNFDALIDQIDHIKHLGVNCIEIMPLAQFPGRFNWGYDGASIYAPYSGYGGVDGFKRFVDACHQADIAVCLDVVYNHFGPEGNYLQHFGPYLSETYHTPWGKGLNYDGAYSDPVREFITKNALYWITEYHVDMLRLDAVHGIYDFSATPMLPEMIEEVQQVAASLGRKVHVTAESGKNDARGLRPREAGGSGLCALWNDDFHHALHVALTGEQGTYYSDYNGIPDLARSISAGFVYDGKYSPFRKHRHGSPSEDLPLEKMIVFSQNHDQTGNRPLGERLSSLVGSDRLKIAAALTLLTPSVPMLFMGEEYGEQAPFEYFVDYSNERLMRSIFDGRKREFHRHDMPYPGQESYDNSCLTWEMDHDLFEFYKSLIAIRKAYPPKAEVKEADIHVYHSVHDAWLAWEFPTEEKGWIGGLVHLGEESRALELPFQQLKGELLLASKPYQWGENVPPNAAFILK